MSRGLIINNQRADVITDGDQYDRLKSTCTKDDSSSSDEGQSVARGGVVTPFPWKVHDMLEKADVDGVEIIVCWLPHGRAFMVHRPQEFVEQVMPIWFSQTKFASFQRQLNLYGFRRLTTGRDKGAYFNQHFLRGERHLIQKMSRQKIKGTKVRRAFVPGTDPDFWNMPFMGGGDRKKSSMQIKLPDVIDNNRFNSTSNNAIYPSGPPTPTLSAEETKIKKEEEVLFFEGKPFHYLDRVMMTDNFHRPEAVDFLSPFLHAM